MKVCVYGAGAVGGHIAARLDRGGAQVAVVARGAYLAAIQAQGLRVETCEGPLHSRPVATSDPADLGAQDIVIVSVKAPALAGIAAGIKPLLGPDTRVVFALNGIPWWYMHGFAAPASDVKLASLLGASNLQETIDPERVVGAVAYTACTVTEPGVISAPNARNRLILGRPDGQVDNPVFALAEVLRGGGLEIELTDRIRDAVWEKLVMNLTGGSLAILTGSAMKSVLTTPAILDAAQRMTHEAAAVAAALGCESGDVASGLKRLTGSAHKQSILQDLELGRSMEIDTILRAPLELARLAGVATPTLDFVVELAVQRARAAGLYRDSTLAP